MDVSKGCLCGVVMSFAFLSSIDLCSPLLIWRIHTLSCCWHSRRFCRAGRRTFLLCSRDAFALRQSHDGSTHLPSCLACHNSSWLSSLSPSCITLFPNRATTSASRIGVTTLWMLIYASYLLVLAKKKEVVIYLSSYLGEYEAWALKHLSFSHKSGIASPTEKYQDS